MRATGRVPAEALRDLLEAAPRASIAFRGGDAIQAAPVAFRFRAGRYWIGVPRTPPGPVPGPGGAVRRHQHVHNEAKPYRGRARRGLPPDSASDAGKS